MAWRSCSSSVAASAAARVERHVDEIVANPTAPLDGCAEQGIEDETEDAGEEDDGAEGGLLQREAGDAGDDECGGTAGKGAG